jgi:hypothetical protein
MRWEGSSVRLDILGGLEDSGVDFIVYRVLQLLEPVDVCAALQVNRNALAILCPCGTY